MFEYITYKEAENSSDYPIRFHEFQEVNDLFDAFDIETCNGVFDVSYFMPHWLVEAHENNETYLIKFLQYYYDWMYCPENSGLHTDNITELQDIHNLNEKTKNAFLSSFIPQIDFDQLNLSNGEIIEFLKNFKRDILQKKGTIQGICLFFSKLFPEVKQIYVNQPTELEQEITLFVDGIDKGVDHYLVPYEILMKPVGIKCTLSVSSIAGSSFFESEEDSDIEQRLAGESGFTLTAYEVPLIGNYFVYPMGSSGTIDHESGCSGSTHPDSIAGNTADMPTFRHPNESIVGALGSSFGNINIYEFLYMDYGNSPNIGITSCS